jgi:hypothetical protein
MGMFHVDHHPSRRQLAVFGIAWFLFFAVVGTIVLLKISSLPAASTIWTLAVAVPLAGCVFPELLRLVYVGMTYVAMPIGWVVSHVVLALVYYLVLTPTGLLMRLFGYDPMRRRFDPAAKTYWIPREQPEDVGRYFRQF